METTVASVTPGLSYERLFSDSAGNLFSVEVAQAGGTGGITVGDQGNLRYDGTLRTATGDLLVLATLRLDFGDFFRAIAVLNNGDLLRISTLGTTRTRDLDRAMFGSIDLSGTDGATINTITAPNPPRLLAAFHNRFVVINDSSVWQIDESASSYASSWKANDIVFALGAARFSRDAFLTKIPDWISVDASYCGTATILTVVQVVPSTYGSGATVTLSDNSKWYSSGAFITSLSPGDAVAHFATNNNQFDFILAIANGRNDLVVPTN